MTKILLVDDEPINTQLLQTMLSGFGNCTVINKSVQVMEEIKSQSKSGKNFDVIYLDIKMPELDGHELLREIRLFEFQNHLPKAKVFMATALDDVHNVMDSFMEDCQEYITKPFDKKEIEGKMEKYGYQKSAQG